MDFQDFINSCFCFGGSIFVANHCLTLYKDKLVKGVSVLSTAFFALWGMWNIYYYAHLAQFASWLAGMLVLIANVVWVVMMIYYKRHPGGKPKHPRLNNQISNT